MGSEMCIRDRGASITAHLGYSPQASDPASAPGDGAQVTYSAAVGSGKEAGVTISYEGLKLGFYGAERERTVPQTVTSSGNYEHDEFNGAWYAKYTMGPVSIGYSEFYFDAGVTSGVQSANAAVTRRSGGGLYSGAVSYTHLTLPTKRIV